MSDETDELERVERLELRLAGTEDHLERAENAVRILGRTLTHQLRTIMAAWIDAERGDHAGAKEWLRQWTENIPELTSWEGSETGAQWLERTGGDFGKPMTTWDEVAAQLGVVTIEKHRWYAIVSRAGKAVTVLAATQDGIAEYESVEAFEEANT